MEELKETPVLVRIAIYGRFTTDRPIPLRWHSLLSELQLCFRVHCFVEQRKDLAILTGSLEIFVVCSGPQGRYRQTSVHIGNPPSLSRDGYPSIPPPR